MRHLLLSIVILLAASTAASAEPLPDPSTYVVVGAEIGGNDGYLTAGGTLEAGVKVVPGLWVHAVGTAGGADELFSSGSGRYTQVRAGIDLIGCRQRAGSVLCPFVSADAGIQHTHWSGVEGLLFGDSLGDGMPVTHDRVRPIGVGRFGVEIGTAHWRFRPNVEIAVSDKGFNGVNLIPAVVYRF